MTLYIYNNKKRKTPLIVVPNADVTTYKYYTSKYAVVIAK